jgi:hypothetical protein
MWRSVNLDPTLRTFTVRSIVFVGRLALESILEPNVRVCSLGACCSLTLSFATHTHTHTHARTRFPYLFPYAVLSNAQVAVILQMSKGNAVNRDEELNEVYRKTLKYVMRFNTMSNPEKQNQEVVDELDNLQEYVLAWILVLLLWFNLSSAFSILLSLVPIRICFLLARCKPFAKKRTMAKN